MQLFMPVNEFVYSRLAYLEWVLGEFAHSADTLEGAVRHKAVDRPGGELPEAPDTEEVHARSASLSSTRLGITAKLDLAEGTGKPDDADRLAVLIFRGTCASASLKLLRCNDTRQDRSYFPRHMRLGLFEGSKQAPLKTRHIHG